MTAFMDLNSSTTALSSMIGLAVGIDYTLFILARYRSELSHTDDRDHAIGTAVGTAGLGRRLRRADRADRPVGARRSSASRSSPRWASRPRPPC